MTDNPYVNVQTRPKESWIAYVLNIWLGLFGAHRFYLRRNGSAIAMLILGLTIVGLLVTAVWSIVDLFLIPGITREENAKLAAEWERRNEPPMMESLRSQGLNETDAQNVAAEWERRFGK